MANTGNTQQQINYGAAVNDGQGDSLRTAFIKTDENFDNIWLAGPVGSNVTITNNTIQANNTNGNLILSPNGIGAIQTNSRLLPRLNNTYDFGSTTLKYRTGYFGTGGLVVDGNVSITGNLSAGNIAYTGNVFVGDLQGSVYADDSTIMVDAVDNELFASGATISGNISADYFIGNGALLTGLAASYGNANVIALLSAFGSNTISTTGNISGNLVAPGANGQVMYNRSGKIGASPYDFNFDESTFTLYVKAGSFSGEADGTDALYVGSPGYTFLGSDIMAQFTGNVDSYSQINFQNINPGTLASGDYIITADNGTDSTYYLDIGLASSNHADPGFFGDTSSKNDAYIYVVGSDETGPSTGGPGNLILGSTNGAIKMFVGNTAQANVVATVDSDQLLMSGNIVPATSNVYSLGNSTNQWSDLYVSNATIYMNNVPLSLTSSNVLTINGEAILSNDSDTPITTTGNITANYFFGDGSQLTGLSAGGVSNGSSNVSIPVVNGNVEINADTQSWAFDTNGNLTLPTNGSIIVDGGDGVIGPVSDDMVISWDNEEIRLVSVQGSIEMQADAAFRVQTNYDGGTDTYLSRWEFNQDEIVNITDTASIVTEAGDLILSGGRDGLSSGNVNVVAVNNGVVVNTWNFDNTGNLTLPLSGNLVGATPNNSGHIQWLGNSSGDGAGYTTLGLIPDDTLIGNDQYLIIDPTAPGHIHIRAGGTQDNSNADLFLGGENSYFKVNAGANNEVRISANSHGWVFGADSTLTLPGEGVLRSIGDTVTLQSLNVGTGNANSVYLGSGGGLGFSDQDIGGNWLEIFRSGTEPEIRVPVGRGNLNIQTAEGINSYNWTFDNTGNLTLPGNTFSVNYANGTPVSISGGGGGTYNDSNVATFLAAYGSNTISTTGNITAGNLNATTGIANVANLYMNTGYINTPASAGINIVPGSTATGTRVWSKLVPNANVAFSLGSTTEYWANGYIGNVISTTVSATGNVTGGNLVTAGLVSATGNVTGGNLVTAGLVSATGNVRGGNLTTTGIVSATGNVTAAGATFSGNVTAANFSGNISITGNVTGSGTNVTLIAGSYSWTFNNTGVATFPAVGGDEGGEIQLGVPAANTTLQNSVKVDVYQDRIRFFEGSANAKGAYIDLANCANGVATAIGYRDIPQITFSANATANINAAGCHYYSTTAGNLALTLPDNSSVAFPTGATLTVVVNAAGNVIVGQGTGVSLYMAGSSTTGNRVVGAYGLASVMKVAANTWVISGTGVY